MNNPWFLLCPILIPILAGLACLMFRPPMTGKIGRGIVGAALAAHFMSALFLVFQGDLELPLITLADNLSLTLHMDDLSRLFLCMVSVIWLLVGIYSFEYSKHEDNKERFFGFFLLTLGAITGVALSGNIVTLYMFYELMTFLSFPMVLHHMTAEARRAGLKYLFYSVSGAALVLLGIFFLQKYAPTLSFVPGGALDAGALNGKEGGFLVVVFLMIIGFGTKAGLFPMQGWLPTAHPAAPAPASALLSGVIAKAGVFGMMRLVFYMVGPDFIRGTWVQYTWSTLALITIFIGSMLAYVERVLKKRLAFSTVSQISYTLFGLSLLHPIALLGSLMHMVYHAVVKNGLFLAAGAVIYKTGKTKVEDLLGIGKQMPVVFWCFTLFSITLVGIPPTSAFVSKWYIAAGALDSGIKPFAVLGPVILLISALLTAGYLLTITIKAFFPGEDFDYSTLEKKEPNAFMTVPLILLTVAAVALGMFPGPLTEFLNRIVSAVL